MKVGFFGHSNISLTENKLVKLKNIIIEIIENNEYVEFYLGGYGVFDYTCAKMLKELKEQYSNFQRIFITPYIDNTYLKNKFDKNLYDLSLYPPLENTPKKFAIIKRNYWIVDNCDFLIFYVTHSISRAIKPFEYAKHKKVAYYNLAN